ncbi:MAG: ankyrin repeat domain-containing protein [Deltaproteobacteria bacterium]|nr:ankyrin repeat domain-containing protein [Deltaproteobacteria bacterium]
MRSRPACLTALACALLVGCRGEPPPAATPTPLAAAPHAAQNLALGLGEPRKPEPFTIEQRLLDAVRRGDRPTIARALELGAPLGARDDIGRGVVLLAVLEAQDRELVRWLHDRGAAVDEPDTGGRTALSFAAATGQLEVVRFLLDQGALVDRRDVQQRTALFHAALGNQPETVALLLVRGADPNAKDQFADTPLIVACAKGNTPVATVLLAHGADPALRDQEGRTAYDRSAPGACTPPATPAG